MLNSMFFLVLGTPIGPSGGARNFTKSVKKKGEKMLLVRFKHVSIQGSLKASKITGLKYLIFSRVSKICHLITSCIILLINTVLFSGEGYLIGRLHYRVATPLIGARLYLDSYRVGLHQEEVLPTKNRLKSETSC